MFNNVDWNKIINNVLSFIEKDWEFLIIKSVFSKASYSMKFYYSMNGKEFADLYNEIDDDKASMLVDNTMIEFEKITEAFKDSNEKMFLTVKVESAGNVRVVYRIVQEGDKLPYDESHEYLRLSDSDKTA